MTMQRGCSSMAEQRLPKPTTRVRFPSPAPFLRWALALVLLSAASFACAQANPRLASVSIEIWPEFDRPAALVIVRGAIAEGVKLPAQLSLRLPASSGGPAAVAYSASADGNLLNLRYEHAPSGAYTIVKFEAPERFFHVEFYDPMTTGDPARTFRYAWAGDFAADRATVVVQEPASAQGLVTDPELKELSSGAAGLNYRMGDIGSLASGKAVPITIKYTKSDARSSVDIKGIRTAQAAAPASPAVQPSSASDAAHLPMWALPMAALVTLAATGVLLLALVRRRQVGRSAAYCTKCGAPLAPGNDYCGKCGAKVAVKRG